MKKLHTSLGVSPRKKLALGAAALTLIGNISPIFTFSAHAVLDQGPQIPTGDIYTLVGPDYFTSFVDVNDPNYTYQIEDTSIADFYTNNGMCNTEYSCLQGKKIGETEIIVMRGGVEFDRRLLISAEMTPEMITSDTAGKVANVTGSLNGADSELLSLDFINKEQFFGPDDGVIVEQTGPRSFRVDSTNAKVAMIVISSDWFVGNQYIGGSSYEFSSFYLVVNAEAEDRINDSAETENTLKSAGLHMMEKTFKDQNIIPTTDIFAEDGTIFRPNDGLAGQILGNMMPKYYRIILDKDEASITKSEEEKHLAKLPENVQDVTFDNISAKVYLYLGEAEEIGEISYASFNTLSANSGNQESDLQKIETGKFIKLGEAINITLDASDAPAVAEGYTRKYYVTITKNNGEVEVVDAEYDAENKSFTFAISEFGNIAYGYVDEEIKEEPAGESVAPKVPNTGSPIQKVAKTAAITFAPLAAIVLGAFMIRNKKKASNKLAKKHNHFE